MRSSSRLPAGEDIRLDALDERPLCPGVGSRRRRRSGGSPSASAGESEVTELDRERVSGVGAVITMLGTSGASSRMAAPPIASCVAKGEWGVGVL